MVKIETAKETRKHINDNHKEYIEQTSLPELEEKIKGLKETDDRCRFLKILFGETEESRKENIIDFCLTDNFSDKLKNFDDDFETIYGFNFSSDTEKNKAIIEATRTDLDDILNYGRFNTGRTLNSGMKWNRHKFITSLGVKVCPYCNRQYITSYEDETDGSKTTADADHYYPKAEYPILQMNIFNLIPSCSVCNSRMKGTSNKKHLYPYKDPSDSLLFEIPLETNERVSEILIVTKGSKRAEASVEVFKLDKIYQAHLDEASEVKERAGEYFGFGEKAYDATYGLKVPFNVFNTWFSFMGKNISSEPLIKLRQDIFYQLNDELIK